MIRISAMAGGHMKPGDRLRGGVSHQLQDVHEHNAKGHRLSKPGLRTHLQRRTVIKSGGLFLCVGWAPSLALF